MTEVTVTKACPQCSEPLIIRVNKLSGLEFLGCTQWPTCDHTEPLPFSIILRRQGAATLPGFGDDDE